MGRQEWSRIRTDTEEKPKIRATKNPLSAARSGFRINTEREGDYGTKRRGMQEIREKRCPSSANGRRSSVV
jgi:hypothetical protein